LNLPGYRLHRLKGSRAGTWSVTVSGNWRITFLFEAKILSMLILKIITKDLISAEQKKKTTNPSWRDSA
jgi:plasmid maintenance system killer protein